MQNTFINTVTDFLTNAISQGGYRHGMYEDSLLEEDQWKVYWITIVEFIWLHSVNKNLDPKGYAYGVNLFTC